jgi:hypothetical protein
MVDRALFATSAQHNPATYARSCRDALIRIVILLSLAIPSAMNWLQRRGDAVARANRAKRPALLQAIKRLTTRFWKVVNPTSSEIPQARTDGTGVPATFIFHHSVAGPIAMPYSRMLQGTLIDIPA